MITTTAMSMDRILVRLLDDENYGKRAVAAFRKILPGGCIVETRLKTEQIEDNRAYDCVIDQASVAVELEGKEVMLFTSVKDRRSPSETFAIIL